SAYLEATQLAGFAEGEAVTWFGRPRGIDCSRFDMTPLPATQAETLYLQRFFAIEAARVNEMNRKTG
ncbi:MAG TPA: hydrolase, partial [Rhizobiaceae bacterium]|nr:hydrolase [Rhizobiaceae bacterium]